MVRKPQNPWVFSEKGNKTECRGLHHRPDAMTYFCPPLFAMRFSLLLSFLLFTLDSLAQTGWVSGLVRNQDGEVLEAVTVQLQEGSKPFVLTDADGYYRIKVPAGRDITLIYSYVGGNAQRTLRLSPDEERTVSLSLKVLVEIGPVAEVETKRESGTVMKGLDPKIQRRIPGPRDGIEAVLMQAPVNFASELSSAYSVRGGSFDENMIYVNDIEVYRPFLVRAGEQEGLSFPNPDMVESIEFSAGGFESRYGDKMSSVLDIRYRKPKEFGGMASGSLMGGALQLESLSKSKKWSHNTGARYRNNAYVLGALDTQGDYNPAYTDAQTFITYKADGNLTFNFLGNYSRNRYNFIPRTRQTEVGNINEALRLTVYFDGQEVSSFETFFGAFSTDWQPNELTMLRFIGSAFRTFEDESFDILGQYFLDEIDRDLGSDELGEVLRNRGVGSFLNHARNRLDATVLSLQHKGFRDFDRQNHYLEWGAEYRYEEFFDRLSEWTYIDSAGFSTPVAPPNAIELRDVMKAVNTIQSHRVMLFLQDTWTHRTEAGHQWKVVGGARLNQWSYNGQIVGGPRVRATFKPRWEKPLSEGSDTVVVKNISFHAATGFYFQPPFYREMRQLDGQLNPEIRAQRSIHFIGGMEYIFDAWDRPFRLTTEAYYKMLNNLIPYQVENVRLRYFGTNNSNGYATGLDVMLNGEFVKGVESWVRASYLRTFEDITDDFYWEFYNSDGNLIVPGFTLNNQAVDSARFEPGFIPRPSDQRFSFSLLFQDEMPRAPEFKVLLSLFFATGYPFGPPTFERYKDVLRTPAYRRVDVGFSRELVTEKNKDKWMGRNFKAAWVSLEVFNLLGINNTINYTWVKDVNNRLYAIPNYLTDRRLNIKFAVRF
jgi:hypothetical protein